MLRHFRTFALLAAGALGVQSGLAFSPEGPINEAYQITSFGFNTAGRADPGAPKNLGEEYRRNTPVLYYACDANFLDYFGSNGMAQVDLAFGAFNAVFNFTNIDGTVITNVDDYSPDLSEFPLQTTSLNIDAETLGIADMKTALMNALATQVGLTDPIRFMWNIHARNTLPGARCPIGIEYLVVQRNFDPTLGTTLSQPKPSSYVNGVLYTYGIKEYCGTPPPPLAQTEALEFQVDLDADTRLPVASPGGFTLLTPPAGPALAAGPNVGSFYTGLTRDDVGGLRYLLSRNNINVETAGPGTAVFVTNAQDFLLTNFSLTLFAQQAATNDPGTLAQLFPGLNIASSTHSFASVVTTTVIPLLTNFPTDLVGTPPHLEFRTNKVQSIQLVFQHTFNNLYIVSNSSHGLMTIPLSRIPPPNGAVLVTNFSSFVATDGTTTITDNSSRFFASNTVVGDAFILPATNCGIALIEPFFTNYVVLSNILVSQTNTTTTTNAGIGSNVVASVSFTLGQLMLLTNRVYRALPIDCPQDSPALREGIQRLTFIRRDFDSLLNRIYNPITNYYYLNTITNSSLLSQRIQRIVNTPDFLISARDQSPQGETTGALFSNALLESLGYDSGNAYPNLAGPGTIVVPSTLTFNKASPIYFNAGLLSTNLFLLQNLQTPFVVWGSFDGTTNSPVIYPTDISIADLWIQALVQISPQYLPDGIFGSSYLAQLSTQTVPSNASNWQSPFSFDLPPNSPGLPPGLNISTNGVISGTPTLSGAYDFNVRATDAHGHTAQRSYSINVVQ